MLPVTVRVKVGPPAVAELGERVVMAGIGLLAALMVKVSGLEVPPPGVGLKTVTLAVPAAAISEAGIAAVSWVAETYVVVRSAPFHRTFDVDTKLVPVTVRVKADPPAAAEVGEIEVRVGTGLFAGGVPVVVNPFTQTFRFV